MQQTDSLVTGQVRPGPGGQAVGGWLPDLHCRAGRVLGVLPFRGRGETAQKTLPEP